MATHSSILAWRIPGKGEPGRLPSMGLQSRTRLKRLSSSSSSSSSRYGMEPENLPNKFHMVAQGLLPKSLVLCALMLNKNTETEFWRKEKE